jgi:hypothetical protein
MDVCRVVVPATLDVAGRRVACHLHDPALTHPPSNTKEHEHVE